MINEFGSLNRIVNILLDRILNREAIMLRMSMRSAL